MKVMAILIIFITMVFSPMLSQSQVYQLGSKWVETEGGIQGVWVRRGNTNIFDGKWENGAVAVLEMELNHNNVKIKRKDTGGPSAGWEITYEGTISSDGKTVKGTEWYPGGQAEWSARIER